jgi:hypothetical protein
MARQEGGRAGKPHPSAAERANPAQSEAKTHKEPLPQKQFPRISRFC